jgi:ferredoxin
MVDISLSALRMGAREVDIVCLERRNEMPAALEEIEEAEAEGIILYPGRGPKRIIGKEGRVTALETLRTMRVFDENKRFNPAFYDGTESQIECDTIIMAIGQAPRLDFLKPDDKVAISPRGLISVNTKTLMTSAPGIFAGGDCVFGPRMIIDSVADGKRAAIGIDEYLRGRKHADPVIEVEILQRHSMPLDFLDIEREPIPMLPLERRTGVTEVEIGYDAPQAMAEAQRCLHCWVNTVFEGTPEDGTACILCGGCVDVCPEDCLELVSLDRLQFTPETVQHIRDNQECFGVELNEVAADELGVVTGSAMLKDETRCIRCGLCAARCPVGTITMESYNFVPGEADGLIPADSVDGIMRTHVPAAGITVPK